MFPTGSNAMRGIGFMFVGTLMFCLADTLMKLSASSIATTETIFIRSLVATLVVGALAIYTGAMSRWREALIGAMAVRAVSDTGASLLFQSALSRMHFADINGVNQLQSLSLTAGSALFLGEKVGWRRWLAIGIGLFGGMLIIKPGTSAFDWWALAALGAVLLASTRDIATRRIPSAVPIPLIMVISSAVVTLTSLAGTLVERWSTPTELELAMMVGAGVFSLLGQFCMISSVRAAELSVVAPFRYMTMIWALILGAVVWRHVPDLLSLLGMATISAAGLYTFHREGLRRKERGAAPD